MPSKPKGLSVVLQEDLNAFLHAHSFPELYRAYSWRNDTYSNGFPDILHLESRLVMKDQTVGISLECVKMVAQWGAMRNIQRIAGNCPVLKPHSLHRKKGEPIPALADSPLTPLFALQNSILKGLGPTYLSKVLRFGLPEEYGAIDTRCVRVFGQGDEVAHDYQWITLRARNAGYGWYIPKAQANWPGEYEKWINILRYFAWNLADKCPHPSGFVSGGLRKPGVWGCADVEMALFTYASQVIGNRIGCRRAQQAR